MTDRSMCWYDENILAENMVDSVKNHPKFEDIGHGKVIIELLNSIQEKNLNLLDFSCGGGHLSSIVKDHKYTGSDLEHVIENVSRVCYPNNEYIYLDFMNDDLSEINKYEIIVLNAILDICEYPLELLDKILKQSKNYVIIHRQEISNTNLPNGFSLTKEPSYGGLTFRTNLERKSFEKIIKENKFSIIKEMDSGLGLSNNESFLLKKDDR